MKDTPKTPNFSSDLKDAASLAFLSAASGVRHVIENVEAACAERDTLNFLEDVRKGQAEIIRKQRAEVDALSLENTKLKHELSEAKHSLDIQLQIQEMLQQREEQLERAGSELRASLDIEKAKHKRATEKIAEMSRDPDVAELQRQVDGLAEEVDSLPKKRDVDRLNEYVAVLTGDLDHARNTLAAKDRAIIEQQKKLDDQEEAICDYDTDLKELSAKLKSAMDDRNRWFEKAIGAQAELMNLRRESPGGPIFTSREIRGFLKWLLVEVNKLLNERVSVHARIGTPECPEDPLRVVQFSCLNEANALGPDYSGFRPSSAVYFNARAVAYELRTLMALAIAKFAPQE